MQKRGVAIFSSFLLLVFGTTAASEMDHPIYAVDDVALLLIGIVSLVMLLYVYRKRKTLGDLKMSLNIFTALILVGVLVKVAFAAIEAGDPDAFGDEIPSIIIGVFILVSRFV